MHLLIEVITDNWVFNLRLLSLDHFIFLEFVLVNEVENFALVKDNCHNLEVGLCIDVKEVKHDIFG